MREGRGNGEAVESVEKRKQLFPSSHRPWKSRKNGEISTFPPPPGDGFKIQAQNCKTRG
jgi:hypothetical protein